VSKSSKTLPIPGCTEATVKFDESDATGCAYLKQDGATMGEMLYAKAGAELMLIDHTEVADSLRSKLPGSKSCFA